MSDQKERFVNIVPFPRIKKEIIEDDEETVHCRLCGKGFVSKVALNNHAGMEHIDAYVSGDPSVWTQVIDKPDQPKKVQKMPHKTQSQKVNISWMPSDNEVPLKKETHMSAMTPANLMALASNDVSYIIIKSDEDHQPKRKRVERTEKFMPKREKQTEPITGPFECLQPSTLVADGTCHQMFFSCCQYSAHHRDEHTRRRKGLRCQVCEKPLAAPGDQQAPYPCDVCGLGCQTSKELSEHTAISHVKLKPYECSICGKRFTQQGGVQQHMRMHTGDRPFPCTFCPKAFTQKSGLDQHLRIHTKVKPYRCVVCGKTFCQSVHLKQHMRTHTNVAPFQCGICEKRFKQSSHLNYHLKNHNPANLTTEQKAKYAELVGIMKGNTEIEAENVEEVNYVGMNDVEEVEEIEEDIGEVGEVIEHVDATQWCVTIDNSGIIDHSEIIGI